MNRIIAACGNDCSACPRYVAHPYEKTEEELRHTAELWMKIGYRDHIVTNEEISCRDASRKTGVGIMLSDAAGKEALTIVLNVKTIPATI